MIRDGIRRGRSPGAGEPDPRRCSRRGSPCTMTCSRGCRSFADATSWRPSRWRRTWRTCGPRSCPSGWSPFPLLDSLQPMAVSLARELGKSVQILIRGGKTEIDRKVAEAIAEPLTQILRNAIDHGIEPRTPGNGAGSRRREGSPSRPPEEGARRHRSGRRREGIDPQEIRETAVSRGFVSEKAARRLDDRELFRVPVPEGIQHGAGTARDGGPRDRPGSGPCRGREVQRRRGSHLHARKGTRVVLEFPFSMSVSRVLLVLSGEQYFGIPAMHSEGIPPVHRRRRRLRGGQEIASRRRGAGAAGLAEPAHGAPRSPLRGRRAPGGHG